MRHTATSGWVPADKGHPVADRSRPTIPKSMVRSGGVDRLLFTLEVMGIFERKCVNMFDNSFVKSSCIYLVYQVF